MWRNRLYYRIKPLIPRSARLHFRGAMARQRRDRVRNVWPILPDSQRAPKGWPGWPGGKQFAFVLTHDVEGCTGLKKSQALMRLEEKLGFRSSFNFIPEGDYEASAPFRRTFTDAGFEVGVHDLRHDGKLYLNRAQFAANAARINRHLRDWGVVGFRSGFMLHNLDWLGDLEVLYDASTFDTDPFEPQPDGVGTIFPFWVPRARPLAALHPRSESGGNVPSSWCPRPEGFVELPYTLPQDSTLFLLLRERHPDIWFQKLDWIARQGGMVLINTHPDYMELNGDRSQDWHYPVTHYERLLEYVKTRYPGAYWNALPREVAGFVQESSALGAGSPAVVRSRPRPKIWIDLDNTPHVPFFEPIIDELKSRGFPVLVTARDAFQVCDLADKKGMPYIKVGRHYGKSPLLKASGLAYRTAQLAPLILREKPAIGVSHGARSQLLFANFRRMPTILLEDYEFAQFPPMMHPTWVMAPEVIPDEALCAKNGNIRKYPGIKEDVYAWKLNPDASLLRELGLSESDMVVTVRPPATEAHYHNPESEQLFQAFMDRACAMAGTRVILLPRNKKQGDLIRQQNPRWFEGDKTVIPGKALDGMNLIWHSDLVVSGGGTMNREAAALGVPVYSIFRGTIGAVDRHLKAEGRLVLVESVQDVADKIRLERRVRKPLSEVTSTHTLQSVVDSIEQIAERYR